MGLGSRILVLLFPTLRIRPRWRDTWEEKERRAFLIGARVMATLGFIGYVVHLVYVDPNLGLEPRSRWVIIRALSILCNVLIFAGTFYRPVSYSRFYRAPLILLGPLFALMQGITMNWFAGVPYVYSIVLPSFVTFTCRLSVPSSVLFLSFSYLLELPAWLNRPQELPYTISAAIVGIVFVGIIRSRLSSDVDAFVAEQENMESQKRLIQAELDLNEQVRAFLPKEIYSRFENLLRTYRMSPMQAMDEVLRARQTTVTCLHSDIRGFTQKTKQSLRFVEKSAIPNIRSCTDLVEKHNGIPKLIGDLVFAYFDNSPDIALLKGLLCGAEFSQMNDRLNQTLPTEDRVNRYVLLSHGEALVGNIGGSDGSRDINVLGSPANILSRIDSLTKETKLQPKLSTQAVILTAFAAERIRALVPELEIKQISLTDLGLKIRDFEEQQSVCMVLCQPNNVQAITSAIARLETRFVPEKEGLAA